MGTKLFIGGLPWSTTSEELQAAFSPYGTVTEAVVISDRYTGRSRGFGFVTFATGEEAEKALVLNDTDMGGRQIIVNEAKDREPTKSFGNSNGGGRDNRGGREDRGGSQW